ncbi:hypothetical protein DL95DRAFT_352126 [Leptodontidium sp. 2 PMI_412]|nr:hypothetical protein DL95DRAFT_352126 [Leptodontidium sp. 2 PMI_412]
MAAACSSGLGRHDFFVNSKDKEKALHYSFGYYVIGLWTASLARISVACMLLRLKSSMAWQIPMWSAIVLQVAVVFGSNVCQFIQCHPLRAMWDMVPDAKCWSPRQMQIYGYLFAGRVGTGIVCDFAFALLPMTFIWTLHRPMLERVLMAFLMALGLFAGGVAVVKVYYMHTFDLTSVDCLRSLINVALWSRIEELVLITAACGPYLKSPAETVLHKWGVPIFKGTWLDMTTIHTRHDDTKHDGSHQLRVTDNNTRGAEGSTASQERALHSWSHSEDCRNNGREVIQVVSV